MLLANEQEKGQAANPQRGGPHPYIEGEHPSVRKKLESSRAGLDIEEGTIGAAFL